MSVLVIVERQIRVYIQPKPTVGGSVLVSVEKRPFLPKSACAIEAAGASLPLDTLVLVGGTVRKERRQQGHEF